MPARLLDEYQKVLVLWNWAAGKASSPVGSLDQWLTDQ